MQTMTVNSARTSTKGFPALRLENISRIVKQKIKFQHVAQLLVRILPRSKGTSPTLKLSLKM